MSDGGKGDAPRPILIDKEEYKQRWNTVFVETRSYCDVCNRKYSWCSCSPAPKELEEAIDKALGIKRKKKNESNTKQLP
jgi:hypothetical protein